MIAAQITSDCGSQDTENEKQCVKCNAHSDVNNAGDNKQRPDDDAVKESSIHCVGVLLCGG